MVYVNILIRDCLRLLDELEALGKFRVMRGLSFIDKPPGLCCNPAHQYCKLLPENSRGQAVQKLGPPNNLQR